MFALFRMFFHIVQECYIKTHYVFQVLLPHVIIRQKLSGAGVAPPSKFRASACRNQNLIAGVVFARIMLVNLLWKSVSWVKSLNYDIIKHGSKHTHAHTLARARTHTYHSKLVNLPLFYLYSFLQRNGRYRHL